MGERKVVRRSKRGGGSGKSRKQINRKGVIQVRKDSVGGRGARE